MPKKSATFTMKETMVLWQTEGTAWHFLPVTLECGKEIKERYGKNRSGFGSLPVEVTIGGTKWKTSIFPDKQSGSYILPIKASVRRAEDIEAGEGVEFSIKVVK